MFFHRLEFAVRVTQSPVCLLSIVFNRKNIVRAQTLIRLRDLGESLRLQSAQIGRHALRDHLGDDAQIERIGEDLPIGLDDALGLQIVEGSMDHCFRQLLGVCWPDSLAGIGSSEITQCYRNADRSGDSAQELQGYGIRPYGYAEQLPARRLHADEELVPLVVFAGWCGAPTGEGLVEQLDIGDQVQFHPAPVW